MAIDKLQLYNNALVLLGQRYLDNLTDEEESQLYLDSVYDFKAVEHCLEISKPTFATKTTKLNASVASADHDLDNVFTLPSGYVDTVEVFSDSKLDQPIHRYILEANTLACEYETIYLRYISNATADDSEFWTPSFFKLVAAYLAREIVGKIDPNKAELIYQLFETRLQDVINEEEGKRPKAQSVAVATVLNQDWLAIYNDALLILGLDGITTNADDSNRRSKIDRALNAGVVAELLEDHPWQFALTSYKSFYDPSLESEWGYSKVHGKPEDMSRLHGLYTDETMRCPLKFYKDEGSNLFSDYEILYIEYISSNLKNTVELWPEFFKRMVAAKLANDAGPSLRKEGADVDNARGVFAERKSSALSNDAAASPPMVIPSGSWNKSRNRSSGRYR